MTTKIHVSDEHRKNELSLIPGGAIIKTVDRKGRELFYDKIKNIEAYIRKTIRDEDIIEIWANGELRWKR